MEVPKHRASDAPLVQRSTREDVVRLYQELLGREPESEEVILQRCGKPLFDLALEFARSDEFRMVARSATREDIVRLYVSY